MPVFSTKTFSLRACLHPPAVSQSPSSPSLSLRVSLVGITWSPKKKPNQASTKLTASFVCRQSRAVEIPLCIRLIIYRYLTTGNHDPGGRNRGPRSRQAPTVGMQPPPTGPRKSQGRQIVMGGGGSWFILPNVAWIRKLLESMMREKTP